MIQLCDINNGGFQFICNKRLHIDSAISGNWLSARTWLRIHGC